jgi:hypothetical protein
LPVDDAAQTIEYYKKAFGGTSASIFLYVRTSTLAELGDSPSTRLLPAGRADPSPQAGERAGEEEERLVDRRHPQVLDPPYDDPVITRGMLRDDLTLEAG